MTNVFLRPGIASPESLVESVKRGISIVKVRHAWFEPDSGLVHLHVVESKLIEHGKTTTELAPLVLSSYPRLLLAGIVGVGNDFAIESDRGYCSKGGATIPVGVGQPTVLIDSMTVAPATTQGSVNPN